MDHFGIGAAMESMVRVYCQSARRTGRTTAMIDNEYCKYPCNLLGVFYSFTHNYIKDKVKVSFIQWMDYVHQFTSMEHLWLAFVMHEKYGKVWDDNEGVWKVVHEQEV